MDKCDLCGAETRLYMSDVPICIQCSGRDESDRMSRRNEQTAEKPAPKTTTHTISVDALIQLHSLDAEVNRS